MILKTKYKFFDAVYIVHDVMQREWQITEVRFLPGGTHQYMCSCGSENLTCYEGELSTQRDYKLS